MATSESCVRFWTREFCCRHTVFGGAGVRSAVDLVDLCSSSSGCDSVGRTDLQSGGGVRLRRSARSGSRSMPVSGAPHSHHPTEDSRGLVPMVFCLSPTGQR